MLKRIWWIHALFCGWNLSAKYILSRCPNRQDINKGFLSMQASVGHFKSEKPSFFIIVHLFRLNVNTALGWRYLAGLIELTSTPPSFASIMCVIQRHTNARFSADCKYATIDYAYWSSVGCVNSKFLKSRFMNVMYKIRLHLFHAGKLPSNLCMNSFCLAANAAHIFFAIKGTKNDWAICKAPLLASQGVTWPFCRGHLCKKFLAIFHCEFSRKRQSLRCYLLRRYRVCWKRQSSLCLVVIAQKRPHSAYFKYSFFGAAEWWLGIRSDEYWASSGPS